MLQPINSSMFSHIGYDADRMTLTVRYHPSKKQLAAEQEGDLWTYTPVVSEKWAEMEAVSKDPEQSMGKWFRANIAGRYTGEKVVEIPELLPTDGSTTRETTHLGETPMEEGLV